MISMALFQDGLLNTSGELQQYENAILDVASTERIDISGKAVLAQNEIATDLLLFLDRNSLWDPRTLVRQSIGLNDIVVNEPLKRWHAYKTLAMVYQDAYNNQLNDRYKGKWSQYNDVTLSTEQALFQTGVAIVHQPVPKASAPSLTVVQMAVTGGTYYLCVSWINVAQQEGLASDPVVVTSNDGAAITVGIPNPPQVAMFWDVYAGSGPDNMTLQNQAPLPITSTWMVPTTGLSTGRPPTDGQSPEWWVVDRRVLPRG